MTAIIEDEAGTFAGAHPHDGYYAGDFSSQPFNNAFFGGEGEQWPR
jgi:hypothetical protein